MQLSTIKIAGFKSFVDPTLIALPSNLVAIVGPNGCGKSNIIDAVTWVMGESSPKYLRGESLTDVIFNGSNARKPVGQASVELVFDNSDATIGGEYANYAEISIKRVINRDSDSTYYLNGVRCRKRDAVGLFLGTGLGPRSYSIIGQNMISRVIEAKPDELRTYFEEAAGISKYKERRHETELRIQHTKENLARVNDVRSELDKQLSHLKHQATVAEKYKALKQQERITRAELLAVQWRQLDSAIVDHTLKIQREETALEARNEEITRTDRDIEQMRHEERVAQDAFQEVQRRYYATGNEITRIEQDILHHQERQQQWENDLKQAEMDWQTVKDQISETEDQLLELDQEIQSIEPEFAHAQKEADAAKTHVALAEEAMQTWQTEWDDFNQSSAQSMQSSQVQKTNIQHLEQKIAALQKREEQLRQDEGRYNFGGLDQELEELGKRTQEAADKLQEQNRELQQIRQQINEYQSALQDSNKQLDQLRSELQRLRGEQASLAALQQTALGQRGNPASAWLAQHQLHEKPRLAQGIEVEAGWEWVVEKVLGLCLQAICVDDLKAVTAHLEDFKSGNLCVVNENYAETQTSAKQIASLLTSKIKSKQPLDSLLSGIYVADTLAEAEALCRHLAVNESIITKDGIWLNQAWIKVLREEDPTVGVFQREQELKKLSQQIAELETKQKELEKNIEEKRQQLKQAEQKRDQLQQLHHQQQAQSAQVSALHKAKQERLAEAKVQSQRILREQEECKETLKQSQNELAAARASWEQSMAELAEQASKREALIQERERVRQAVQTKRQAANDQRELTHELEVRLQTAKSQKVSLQQNTHHLQTQLTSLSDRKTALQSELSSMPPLENLKKSLSRTLDKHVSIEVELNTARMGLETLNQEFRSLEDKRQILEKDINRIRTVLETLRVEWQGWKVKLDTIVEQIKETEFTLETVMQNLTAEIHLEEWQAKLDQIIQRINRLGPINLVAIDEYATCLERKQYLDAQFSDLEASLQTLDEAIAKIDKETRVRFKETFDQVNQRFQELFPTIFGGGKAYLELTSDDLLACGVTMMACPPGKRNSSIYLLSGGEKSLTAIAFIFSIFYLNPAPFCLLDEVDAALDDANVLRFTRLVKSMADKTQFIFISHNKITIEMGEHLIGVTMNEPGVSRLVSVDIEKAIGLAEEH